MKPEKPSYDPALHHRRSIRLKGHDYSQHGVYFITICTKHHPHCFGRVVNGRMMLNDAGRAAARCRREIPRHFPHASLDEWIIMPDHIHGIIILHRDGFPAGANPHSPPRPRGTSRTIGSIIRGFKIGVTRSMGESPWQRDYYDIIVRDNRALNNICAYIRNNPAQWDVLRYGEPRFFAGNRALLDMPMTAFLASRGDARLTAPPPSRWPSKPDCVIGGFLSPMERDMFDAGLAEGVPMIQVLARGLPSRFPPPMRRAMDRGQLLVTTPFDESVTQFSAKHAAWCNQYVLHTARDIVVGHLTPDGMLACLLSEQPSDKEIAFLCSSTR